MSVTFGPRRGFIINALTGDGFDAAFRAFLRGIDALLSAMVINLTTSTPPGSPANGDTYIVKATGTGAWAGHDNAIAIWTTDNPTAGSGEWEFYAAARGMVVCNVADSTLYFWNGTAWTAVAGGGGGGSATLAGDTDVSITSPANNDLLTYESSSSLWKNKPATGGGSSTLAGDTDVVISSPANLDLLTYDTASGKWKNKPAAGGGGGSSGAIFEADGDATTGFTTGGGIGSFLAGQSTSGFTPFDFVSAFNSSFGTPGFIDLASVLPGSSFAGTIIEFDAAAASGAFIFVGFGMLAGNGPFLIIDGRGGSNLSGIGNSTSTWSRSAGGAGPVLTSGVWYHVKVIINKAGTFATYYLNGVAQQQVALSGSYALVGTQLGMSSANNGGYVANIRVYTS